MEAQDTHEIREQTSRPTIGLLVTWLRDGYENGFLLGVADAAAALDVNLICLVGGELRWNVPQTAVFDLVGPEKFDGLIISGTLGHALAAEDLARFCARFAPLPMVGGALPVPGVVQVLPDSISGMREAVEHLITVHGYRRIAFIQGPAGQLEAEERYRAYTEVLLRHGLSLDPALVVRGDYRRVTGQAAMEELLARGAPLEAVVSANDDMAFGAFDVLQAHGLRVPEDVALVGFDDVDAAQFLEAPLTTVRQSFTDAARIAAETVLALIRGEPVPDIVYIPTQLVLRRSCGCQLEAVRAAAVPVSAAPEPPVAWEALPPPVNVPAPVWQAFGEDVTGGASSRFLTACTQALRNLQAAAQPAGVVPIAEVAAWHTTLSALRRAALPHLVDRAQLLHAENLLQQARVLVSAEVQRLEGYRQLALKRQETHIQEFDRALMAALSLSELQPPVERYFPALGIRHAYMALYPAENEPAEHLHLAFSYEHEHGARAWEPPMAFPARQLLPEGMGLEQQRYTAVLVPLLTRNTRLGVMLLELGPRDGAIYDRLGEQFSGSVYRMSLLQHQAEVQAALEASRQEAETALRDLLALQRQYIREAWRSADVSGATHSYSAAGAETPAWLPAMTAAVAEARSVQQPTDSGYSLGVPLTLYGEIVGLMGLERQGSQPWTEAEIAMVEGLLEQAARAVETRRLVAETRYRAAQLRTATEIAQITSSILSLQELITQAVNLLEERFGYYYVGLFLVEETGRWAVLRAGTGEAGRIMLERGHRLEVGGASMIGQCILENQARIALDVGAEAVRFDNPLLPETRSEAAVPLRSRGRAIGAMTLQSVEPAAFSEEDLSVLQTVADQLGNAIETVRLLDEMERTVRALEAAQGRYTQESWHEYLETVGKTIGYRYRLGLESAPALLPEEQAVLAEQQPVITRYGLSVGPAAAPEATHAAIALPLRLREQTIGVLDVRFEAEEVPPETLELLEQIAEQVTLSLESARLYQATQQQAAQERLISETTARIREQLDMDAVLKAAVHELQQVLGLERVELRVGTPPAAEELQ